MAREIHEREDLLRDARALVPRVLLRVEREGHSVEVFAGFRGESLSLYFGDDPVFHFNSRGELRRAFVGDRLIKAERRRLISLERKRTAQETALERMELDADSEQAVLYDLSQRLREITAAFSTRMVAVVGQVPADGDAVSRLGKWLALHSEPAVAASLHVS
jgi:hypothetical protein